MNNKRLIIAIIIFLSIGQLSQLKCQSYEHLIMYGQSLATGQQSWPSLSTTAVPNNYMIGNQVWTNYNNPVTNTLNPLIANMAVSGNLEQKNVRGQMSCESPIVGVANYIQLKTASQTKFIASSCGYGGRTIEQLSKEYYSNLRYNDFKNCINYASSITSNNVHCPAIFWMQGEYNYYLTVGPMSFTATNGLQSNGLPTADKARYKSLLLTLKDNMQNDIKIKYNQTDNPLFITYQVGKEYTKGIDMQIGMAQLEASNEYNDIVCAGPVYYLPDRGGHLDPNGYRWYGEMLGKVFYKAKVLGEDFKPLQPMEISRSATNPKKIIIKFLVPQPPLVLDINLTQKRADYGFQVNLNGTKVALSSVAINNDCIELTSSVDLTGDLEIIYAGINTSGKGNLRDSDPTVAYNNYIDLDKVINNAWVYERNPAESLHPYTPEPKDANGVLLYDKPYPLYNFSVAFYYTLKKDEQTYIVPNLTQNTSFVNVGGVQLSPSVLNVNVGASVILTPQFSPTNATNKSVLWTSSDPSITTVINGVVTAVGAGSSVVYAKSVDQQIQASCTVVSTAITENAYPNGATYIVPTTCEFENYDSGGEGTAYHDATAGNSGGIFRPMENVDIETCSEGGYNIYSTTAGEWLKYTIKVSTAQSYKLGIRYASASTCALNIFEGDVNVSGSLSLPATYSGSSVVYKTYETTIQLSAGSHTLKFLINNSSEIKLNNFTLSVPTGVYTPSALNDSKLTLYPNPAKDYVTIKFKNTPSILLFNYF